MMLSEEESAIRDVISRMDFNSMSNNPHISSVNIIDPELGLQILNRIKTNELITRHVLDCRTCIDFGLRQCNILKTLQGVYDKFPRNTKVKEGKT